MEGGRDHAAHGGSGDLTVERSTYVEGPGAPSPGLWDQAVASTEPLTADDIRRAAASIRNAPPHPCSLGKHVVHPDALYRPGVYPCGNCGAPVEISIPLSEVWG